MGKITSVKFTALLLVLLSVFTAMFAATASFTYAANDSQNVSIQDNSQDISSQNVALQEKIQKASEELKTFFEGSDRSDIVIVTGTHISVEDKVIFKLIQTQLPEASGILTLTDKQALKDEDIYGKTLILLGSEKTNYISNKIFEEKILETTTQSDYDPLILKYGYGADGQKILLLYSQKEVLNNENRAIKQSPLNRFMDEKYVPFAATFISILLLYLWKLLGETLLNQFNDYISSKFADKTAQGKQVSSRKLSHHKNPKLKIHQVMHWTEVRALFVSVIIFSFIIAWTWTDTLGNFWNTLLLSFAIVGSVTLMKEYIKQNACYRKRICVEYVFWPFGTLVALVSTYLGNTISRSSYGLGEDKDEDTDKFGRISFIVTILTLAIALSAYVANIVHPSLMLQIIFVFAILTAFIDMFPLSPMDGADMKKWNFPAWLILYIIVIACYVFMNFTTYI